MQEELVKFKFINHEFDNRIGFNRFVKVKNPIGVQNLPTGEYLIRGDKKSHRKTYFHVGNDNWYLVDYAIKDNGHYMADACRYELFPSLPEKEWDKIRSCSSYLSHTWKRYLYGHDFYMELREMTRNIKKGMIKYLKS